MVGTSLFIILDLDGSLRSRLCKLALHKRQQKCSGIGVHMRRDINDHLRSILLCKWEMELCNMLFPMSSLRRIW